MDETTKLTQFAILFICIFCSMITFNGAIVTMKKIEDAHYGICEFEINGNGIKDTLTGLTCDVELKQWPGGFLLGDPRKHSMVAYSDRPRSVVEIEIGNVKVICTRTTYEERFNQKSVDKITGGCKDLKKDADMRAQEK